MHLHQPVATQMSQQLNFKLSVELNCHISSHCAALNITAGSYFDGVKVLHPTRHKMGHFGNVLPSQSLGIVLKKLNQTQQKQTTQEQNSLS